MSVIARRELDLSDYNNFRRLKGRANEGSIGSAPGDLID